jgi:predicted RNase H-like HicB family nuclease/uncharacterized damage-inducible protein DinB
MAMQQRQPRSGLKGSTTMNERTAPLAICLERIEQRWTAHVVELPGCSVTAESPDACLARLPEAIRRVEGVLGITDSAADREPTVIEQIIGWEPEPRFEINAFFASDAIPLTEDDVERATLVLADSRADLQAAIAGLTSDELRRDVEEGWSIARVLGHIARAEWWYLDRLGRAFPPEQLPDDELERLARVRERLNAMLPSLAGDRQIIEKRLEIWSARKVIRRACYHERDHTEHIRRLRMLL